MTTERERNSAAAEAQPPSQRPDEVETSISAIEKAVGLTPSGSLARNREAIHKLGCRIVAQALKKDDGSG
jgi:hypothetical protein